jgi:diaminohydroxyphosphoribosylaminopyrimidine deaminase/5-amino-6-(5-phosphoribosylamino)uracil reductase
MTPPPADTVFMSRALALAERGRGRTSPNPVVGAVVVDDEGVVVGRGAHELAGGPHAEVHALNDAGSRARGATLYCTLEPCCHTGRTGPCAPRVAEAGIRRAVIAIEDPNPLVAGGGLAYLRAHGVEVAVGVGRDAAERQNRPFFTFVRRHRPFVTMKAALSLDACIAAAPGTRTFLTGRVANRAVHRLRAEVDAIAIGSGTLLADDPLLTARGIYRYRPLVRVVFDRRLRTPPSARLLSTLEAGPVIIMSTEPAIRAAPDRARALRHAGARIEAIDTQGDGPAAATVPLAAAFCRLADAGVTSMIVEGGASFHRAVWTAGLVDRVQVFVSPRAVGDTGVPWLPYELLALSGLTEMTAVPVGDDVLIEAYVHRTD